MQIMFPNIDPTITKRGTVAFQAVVETQATTCEISVKALQDHFGAVGTQPHDLIRAFISGKPSIHNAAREAFSTTAGRWLLLSTNF